MNGEEVTARHVISAIGPFVDPKPHNVPGVDDFEGKLIHSARWDHDYDLTGKRVAIVGTGASAVQIVPSIARRGRPPRRLPADPDLDRAEVRPEDPEGAAEAVRAGAVHREGRALGDERGRRDDRRHPAAQLQPDAGAWPGYRGAAALLPAPGGQGPGAAREADAALRARLQAAGGVQPLLAGVQPRQRRPRHRSDRDGDGERRADRRRDRARGRRADPRDRIPDGVRPRGLQADSRQGARRVRPRHLLQRRAAEGLRVDLASPACRTTS